MSLRVVVNVGAATPELLADLRAVPPRARAERLRSLATLGLRTMRTGSDPGTPASAPRKDQADTPSAGTTFTPDGRMDSLIAGLAAG